MRPPRHRRPRRALTLMELLLTIGLLALLAALVMPDFTAGERGARLAESERRLRSLVALCRAEAMNQAVPHRIVFLISGEVHVQRQRDPLRAPHQWISVPAGWANTAPLLDDVWIESVLPLPDGPPPLIIEDDAIEFEEYAEDAYEQLIPVDELEDHVYLEFTPDGRSDSLRWLLREAEGRGLQMTLDGRLGRVFSEPVESVEEYDLLRPEPLTEDQWEDLTFYDDEEPLDEEPLR